MEAERTSSTSPLRQTMRSFKSREKMSDVWKPPPTVSVTKGMGRAELGGLGCCDALLCDGWNGSCAVVVRARTLRMGMLDFRSVGERSARDANLVRGSIVVCLEMIRLRSRLEDKMW